MKKAGELFTIAAVLMWIFSVISYPLMGSKIDSIYGMVMAIGLLLLSNRMIRSEEEKD